MSVTLERIHKSPIFQAWNPQGKEFLEVRWLPEEFNPFISREISIGAVVLKRFPHIKTVSTIQMMLEDFQAGCYEGKHTIVVPSSGNTAHAVARLAREFGLSEVKVVLSADVPDSKKGTLTALSVDIIGVGGGKSVESRAREIAEKNPGHVLLDQYGHMGNLRGHEFFTGPEIVRAFGGDISLFAIAMGSGGTVAGVGKFFHEKYSSTVVLGVRPSPGERVPGARDKARMDEVVTLPWQEFVTTIREVPRKESFVRTRELWRWVEPQPGPSSGLAYGGLIRYLQSLEDSVLEKFRGKRVGFLCPDSGTLYSGLMSSELDTGEGLWVHI